MSIKTGVRFLVIVVICGLMPSVTFAQNLDPTTQEITEAISNFFQLIIGFLSWAWILFVQLAGKLMTNEFVYGSLFGLDTFLRKMWNVTKTLANFVLGFGFLYLILKEVLMFGGSGKDATKFLSSSVPSFLLAAVAINVSWFAIGALIDISTILTSAVGAFPSIFIGQETSKQAFVETLREVVPQKINCSNNVADGSSLFGGFSCKLEGSGSQYDSKEFLDYITPKYDHLGGALFFMGASLFQFQGYSLLNDTFTPQNFLIGTALKFGMLIVFSIALLILVIVNLVRIGTIWIGVILSPFIALFRVLGKELGGTEALKGIGFDKPEKLIDAIFKPVILTGIMSIMLVLLIGMSSIMLSDSSQNLKLAQNVQINSAQNNASSTLVVNNGLEYTVQGDIFGTLGSGAQQVTSQLVLYIFTLFLLFQLVYFAASQGSSVTKIAETIAGKDGLINRALGAIPIIPGTSMGTNALRRASQEIQNMGGRGSLFQEQEDEVLQGITNRMRKNLGLQDEIRSTLNRSEQSSLKSNLNQVSDRSFFNFLNSSAQLSELGLNNSDWQNLLRELVQKHIGKSYRSPENVEIKIPTADVLTQKGIVNIKTLYEKDPELFARLLLIAYNKGPTELNSLKSKFRGTSYQNILNTPFVDLFS